MYTFPFKKKTLHTHIAMSLFGSGSFCACTESGVGNPLVRHGTSKSGLHTSSFFATYPSRWAGWAGCGGVGTFKVDPVI